MFYCTIYASYPNGTNTYHIVFSLKYSTEQEADNFRTWFSDLATKYGLEVKTEGEDITCTGNATWWYYKFVPGSRSVIKYTLSIETDETLHSKYDFSKGYSPLQDPVEDGPAFENKIQQVAAKDEAENKANQEKLLAPVNRFIEETSGTSDLKVILTSLLKCSRQKCNREALLDAAIKKIQGGSNQIEKTSDWYDELSDINK